MVQRLMIALLVCIALGQPGVRAEASETLDVKSWLDRPGVKLLAVEFYATWCKPCMAAVPKWKALHERYADQGLRLIVVATRDPRGQCQNPGWNPDQVICDTDGKIADALGVGNSLPSAFLWSWRGKLLVRGGHVNEVSEAVKSELRAMPRILIESPDDADPPRSKSVTKTLRGLSPLVESELVRRDKVTVLAGKKAARAIAKARRKARGAEFEASTRCQLGKTLAPNSMLRLDLPKVSGKQHLSLQLFDLETGCISASSFARLNPKRPEVSVGEAVSELTANLRMPLELPAELSAQAEAPPVPEPLIPPADGKGGVISVETRPLGLKVILNGTFLGVTPLRDRAVPAGQHTIRVEGECEGLREESITVEAGAKHSFSYMVRPSSASLRVDVVDAKDKALSAQVFVDGKEVGTSPGPFHVPACSETMEVRHETKGRITRDLALQRNTEDTITVTFANPQGFVWALERDFRQGLWAAPEDIIAAYKLACRDGDLIACTQAWHQPHGAVKGFAATQMFMPCGVGHAPSCLGLSWMATQGPWSDEPQKGTQIGVESKGGKVAFSVGNDPRAGFNYAEAGCRAKLQRACVEQGRLHAAGVGTPQDERRAVELFATACDLGELRGCSELAVMKRLGRGGKQDLTEAQMLAKKACGRGDMHGCRELGYLHEHGQSVTRNERKALSFYLQACDGGHMDACFLAGGLYEGGRGATQDTTRAKALYSRACYGGHVASCQKQ